MPRASSRLATLADASTSSRTAAAISASDVRALSPTSDSRIGVIAKRDATVDHRPDRFGPRRDRVELGLRLRRRHVPEPAARRPRATLRSQRSTRSGIHASTSYGKRKPGPSTPMTVAIRSSTRRVRPTTSGRPPNCRCHSEWLRTTTFASSPACSSSAREQAAERRRARPAARTSRRDTRPTDDRHRGGAVEQRPLEAAHPDDLREAPRLLADGQEVEHPVRAAHLAAVAGDGVVLQPVDARLVGNRQRSQQRGVDHVEDGAAGGDADGQRADQREPRSASRRRPGGRRSEGPRQGR